MKMPNARQISEEQQDIFEDAPTDGAILVSGPPGTGKTVIAFMRAELLAKLKKKTVVLMYNRVLRKYTENIASIYDDYVETSTMHSWFFKWWKKQKIPNNTVGFENGKVYLNCPFQDKEALKLLGGRWDKTKRNPFKKNTNGCWYIPENVYSSNILKFERWVGFTYDPVMLEKWIYDWDESRRLFFDLDESQAVDWGHLIIDEGQDFEPSFYSFLRSASRLLDEGGVTVLADENQRLEESKHSTIEEIKKKLKLCDKKNREFKLTKNFRNTKQIAEVARFFYAGLKTGIPTLPEREGNICKLLITTSIEQQCIYIIDYLKIRAAQEVCVIVDTETDREFFYDYLSEHLKNYDVQTYTSKNTSASESLDFDTSGTITVINRKSCKGLEFDFVFVPQIQKLSVNDSNLTTFKMNMYVTCSRARSELIFLLDKNDEERPEILRYFPSPESALIVYEEIGGEYESDF